MRPRIRHRLSDIRLMIGKTTDKTSSSFYCDCRKSVLLHVGLLVEALAAELAGVRSRVRVDEQVRGQRGRALERLAALLALQHMSHAVKRESHVTHADVLFSNQEINRERIDNIKLDSHYTSHHRHITDQQRCIKTLYNAFCMVAFTYSHSPSTARTVWDSRGECFDVTWTYLLIEIRRKRNVEPQGSDDSNNQGEEESLNNDTNEETAEIVASHPQDLRKSVLPEARTLIL
ncbi:hypothetical protein ANN_00943 [Periplaneta americana]|uniref:Uncharacterized protein n=1 Tax=Periplaneta americana TaxID=6978 RepID=A0ABQ8TTZ6_PERAM|nr:hypothetical protein ANN_00943 [Periplaneta americana]